MCPCGFSDCNYIVCFFGSSPVYLFCYLFLLLLFKLITSTNKKKESEPKSNTSSKAYLRFGRSLAVPLRVSGGKISNCVRTKN